MKSHINKEIPLRVLHIIEYLNQFGGTPRKLLMLCRNINRRRYKLFIARYGQYSCLEKMFSDCMTQVIHLPYRKKWNALFVLDIISICHRNKINVIATHFARANIYGAIAAKILRIPVIAHEHGLPRNSGTTTVKTLDMCTALLRDIIVCNSNAVLEKTKAAFLFNRNNLMVIHNSLDLESYKYIDDAQKESIRSNLGLSHDNFIFGFFGSFIKQRDHATLIEAFRLVHQNQPMTRLLLVGDGETRKAMQNLVNSLNVADSVIFLGYRKDIANFHQIIGAYVDTTSIASGFAFTLMEAMYYSVPVITTMEMKSGDEYVTNMYNGIVIPPKNPRLLAIWMTRLIKDRTLARKVGYAAHRTIRESYNANVFVDRMTSLYRKIARVY